MSLFFETIFISNTKIRNLKLHNKRLNKTIKHFFGCRADVELKNHLSPPPYGKYRCKVTYSKEIENVEYFKIKERVFKSFKIVESDTEYPFKSLDRSKIDELFNSRGDSDDIIITKNGMIRDTSIANIALFDGSNWITPKNPLLRGTVRESLINRQFLLEKDVKIEDIENFEKFAILNAIVGFYVVKEAKFNF
jgi:4-amino-4-deoxychorismate lyase